MRQYDVIVLGAGMVGVSVAAHLAARGVATALVDRRGPGEETSYGNAGLVEASRVLPVAFPRRLRDLMRHAFGRTADSRYRWRALPALAPFLVQYWAQSRPDRLVASARALRPLLAAAAEEHTLLADCAGAAELLRPSGWLKLIGSRRTFERTAADRALADELGVPYEVLDRDAVLEREPHLRPVFQCAELWPRTMSCPAPGELVRAYAGWFERRGGQLLRGDARKLQRRDGRWRLATEAGLVDAAIAVVALGPWSMDLLQRFGVRVPFAVKRGYHLHLAPVAPARLGTPILDLDGGYLLAPMRSGIRLTTGVEFAARDAPPSSAQLERVLPRARRLLPLAELPGEKLWLGSRPVIADSLPVIGPLPECPALYGAFGHGHLGFTLGPPTGRLIAEMLTQTPTFVEAAPFGAARFRSRTPARARAGCNASSWYSRTPPRC